MRYGAGIALAAAVGAVAIMASRPAPTPEPALEPAAASRRPRWRRKSRIIAELQVELARTGAELDDHRRALANLGAQLTRESEAARATQEQLESHIRELETERDELDKLIAAERERFEQTLEQLGGGLGRHDIELAELERELEALIGR
jgi:flagellar motility protein MotE (MotC chaperone)